MLERELLRSEGGRARELLAARGVEGSLFDRWTALDAERRSLLGELEALQSRRNEESKEIGRLKSRGEDAAARIAAVGEIKETIGALEERVAGVDRELVDVEMGFPNLPHESVPRGADESANRVERVVGEPRAFDFEPRAHWDLGPELGILDFERAAKLTGARFAVYFGLGARLERALVNFMLDLHTAQHGYTEVLPPFLVNAETLTATGQLPKFEQDLFKLEPSGYYLIPTAEVPVTNLHSGETLAEADLPRRYVAFTPCFRAEAGSYGKDVRGLIRQHQFQKVELVQLTTPETSYEALAELTGHAERVLQLLELPYRVVCLASGDMSFASAKTYDLEVWLPGQDAYREISSCSNCTSFQARRAGIRYRPEGGGKPRPVHTLNGSGLAVGRTLVAVLENYQQADGSIVVPTVLRPFLGVDRIPAP
ncbi:MAG: serine--tRNA ligase [Acidobacteriota bacterium]|nr:serine--tRNA ligase [Acidobacteriota bacterium]MDH3522045.1 serine--tRNA ligase [Acidobacteriota bacterium]